MPNLNLFKKLLTPRFTEYLVLDRDFLVQEISSGIQKFADFPYRISVGDDARIAFPELIGYENITDPADFYESRFELEGIAREHDGITQVYFNLYGMLIEDRIPDSSTSQYLLLCLEDVTEKMTLRQELLHRSNETQLLLQEVTNAKAYNDRLLSCIGDVVIVTTAKGVIKSINAIAESILGYHASELFDRPLANIISDRDLPFLTTKERLKDWEVTFNHKDGIQVILSLTCSKLEVHSLDFPQSLLIEIGTTAAYDLVYVGKRVSAEELAQKQLRSLTTHLSILLEHLPQGILLEDRDSKVLLVNDRICQILSLEISSQLLLGTECVQSREDWRSQFSNPDRFISQVQTLVANREQVLGEKISLKNGTILERDYIPITLESSHAHLWQYRIVS